MPKYTVYFSLSSGKVTELSIEANNKEEIIKMVIADNRWYVHKTDKGHPIIINLDNVTQISIQG